MNFLNLDYFLVVCQEMNISRAAEKLYISQQTLSNHIHRLEEYYGTPLFERMPRLRLTLAGELVRQFALDMQIQHRQLKNQLNDIRQNQKGRIAIGLTPTRARLILPSLLPRFQKDYPLIQVHVIVDTYKELEKSLLEGRLDLILCTRRASMNAHIVHQTVMKDHMCVIIPPALAKKYGLTEGNVGSLPQSKRLDQALSSETVFTMSNTQLGKLSLQYLTDNHIVPASRIELPDLETIWELVLSGSGLAFTFEKMAEKKRSSLPAAIAPILLPIKMEHAEWDIIAGYYEDRYLSFAARQMLAMIQKIG
ncbi:LysR family transcriptional regulator [Hominifimenecus sp. rT4P-3]|uniref:LysR family transcriptional regulator n=1 Tax=Hominifimenecus sp. rT4P-3 TaxID=3242979 RepID=UPI003DA43053